MVNLAVEKMVRDNSTGQHIWSLWKTEEHSRSQSYQKMKQLSAAWRNQSDTVRCKLIGQIVGIAGY